MSIKNNIPSLDLNDFNSKDPNKKNDFVKNLGKAYEKIGFVAIENHGLSDELTKNLYKEVYNFFNLPLEDKLKYEKAELNGQRGYISFGRETAQGSTKSDLKEFWHFGQELSNSDPLINEYKPNILCEELPDFNKIGRETFEILEKTGLSILRALAIHLKLPETYFDQKVKGGNSILRAIHYPPIKTAPKGAVRAAAHGDINLITILMGASAKGLEIQTRNGDWIAVTALPKQVIVNIGDMMSRLTNNKLHSSIHQVTNPPKKEWGTSRFSIPFFMHPRSEMSLNCLESCITELNPKQYNDISAGQFLNERIKELGLKK
ncbi:MAG: isopenicillin N synthase family oxygenase [Flavobacteriales bacterium TMED191]|nr:MAG: isopenicillin N synthase family oxygenase [Flavobacteriales bacterium TMED191]|tara:strand:+ start:109 stop:1065 length:957 start_codon:yes stop_codon:yes gene_type:complete